MRRSYLYTLLFFSLFLNVSVYAQLRELQFKNYSISEGLSHNTVHCIAQDKKGFLWMGTEDGLNRFDGYSFTVFKKNKDNPFSIPDNYINCLFFDEDDNLWIGTNNKGFCVYDKYTEHFRTYSNYTLDGKTLPFKMVYAITADSKGHLWIGTFSGLFEFDPQSEKIVSQYHYDKTSEGLSEEEIRSLYMDKNDILWIGTNFAGLNRLDLKTREFTHFKEKPDDESTLSQNSVSTIFRDRADRLWIGTNWGLNIFDENTGKFKHFQNDPDDPGSISNNIVFSICQDHLDNIWVGTLNGLNLYDDRNNNFKIWKYIPTVHQTISDNYIFSIFEDRFGQIWIGTGTKGADKLNNQVKKFRYFYVNLGTTFNAANNTIREIYEDNDLRLWIGILDGGLFLSDPETQRYSSYRHIASDPGSLSDDRVITIFRDHRDNVWVGTWGGGLNRAILKNKTYRFEHFFHNSSDPSSIAANTVQEIVEDEHGRIWLGTESGLDLFDPVKKTAIHFPHDDNNPNSLINNNIQSGGLVFDRFENLWVGTWGGLSRVIFSKTTGMPEKFMNYQQNDSSDLALSDNRIISLKLDDDTILWAGTFGGGLNRISLDKGGEVFKIRSYTEQNGLSNNVVYSILKDNFGFLWLSTNNGLSRFDPKNETFTNYDVNDGLQSNQFYWGAGCKLRSGELAFGGINGYNTFFPEDIIADKVVPEMVITDFRIAGQKPEVSADSKLNRDIIYADTILLNYHDKAISFEFSALQFADPAKNSYQYKLEGFNDSWVETDASRRFAIFTNLDPGTYTFMVRGSNADGVWSDNPARIKVIVAPPFWGTWWFRTGMVLFTIALLFTLYKFRIASLQRQKDTLELTVKEKTEEILRRNNELQMINEEFVAANQKLELQRQELEIILQSLKEAQNQLIQSEKMASLGVLAAGIAHEINNPLNFIHWGVEGLQDYLNENMQNDLGKVAPLINGIKDGIKRAADIVSSLNIYSRKDDLPASEVDIHEVLESCLVMLNNQIKDRITVNREYSKYHLRVLCNEGRMHQVFLNILTNAIHSMPDTGSITIITKKKKSRCLVSITDTGCGIPRDLIPKIMDPFFTTKDPGKGTGLGLSITYNILKDYDGTIDFESEENRGTTVLITLPVTDGADL